MSISDNKLIRGIIKKFLGFSVVGGFITALSLFLSFFFLKIIGTPLYVTYVCLYVFMILFSYYLNSRYVFKVKRSLKQSLMFFGVYISGMLVGVLVLKIYKQYIPLENWMLSYLVIPITMSWNFILSSFVLKEKKIKYE